MLGVFSYSRTEGDADACLQSTPASAATEQRTTMNAHSPKAPRWQSAARCAQTAEWCAASESCSAGTAGRGFALHSEPRKWLPVQCDTAAPGCGANQLGSGSSPCACPLPGRCPPQSSAASACRPGRWTGRCCAALRGNGSVAPLGPQVQQAGRAAVHFASTATSSGRGLWPTKHRAACRNPPCRCGWYMVRLKLISTRSLHWKKRRSVGGRSNMVSWLGSSKATSQAAAVRTAADPSTACAPIGRVSADEVHVTVLKTQGVVPAGKEQPTQWDIACPAGQPLPLARAGGLQRRRQRSIAAGCAAQQLNTRQGPQAANVVPHSSLCICTGAAPAHVLLVLMRHNEVVEVAHVAQQAALQPE